MLRRLFKFIFPRIHKPGVASYVEIDGRLVRLPQWVGPRTLNALAG